MQLHSIRSSQANNPPKEAIPYSLAALHQDLERVRNAWDDCQASRDRGAIYGYLTAVYDLVAWWAADRRETDRSRRALRLWCLDASGRKTRSPRSFGAPPTPARQTNGLGASGAG
jgi:hypothetical protein